MIQPEHERAEPRLPLIDGPCSRNRRRRPRAARLGGAVALLILTGCSVTYSTGAPPSPAASPAFASEPIFVDGKLLTVRREYLDRYTCRTKAPLLCDCGGRLTTLCLCRC